MVYDMPPQDFLPKLTVAACFIEFENKVLFLHRAEQVSQGGTWAIPGGKVHKGETPLQAIQREVVEECQINLPMPEFMQTVYIRYPDYDYEYSIFKISLDKKPTVIIDHNESQDYAWLTREQVDLLEEQGRLILDEMPCIERIYAKGGFGIECV